MSLTLWCTETTTLPRVMALSKTQSMSDPVIQITSDPETLMENEAENDCASNGPVQIAECEFCNEPADECQCGDGE